MTDLERDILKTLQDLDAAVKSMAQASPKPNLIPIFERLDQLAHSLPRGSDPNLLHYLHKKSYEKALLHLQGRDSENQQGSCRH